MSEVKPFTELLSKIVDNRGRTCPTSEDGIPLIATNCINNDALYPTYEKARHVSQETYDTWFRGHPEPGDLIFVTKGSPGRVCMAPDPVDFCIAQDMVAVRSDPKKIYPKYLFAALRSHQVQQAIGNMHVGTLIPHFKKGDFDKLGIPVPKNDVQEVIGDMYYTLSAKIELNRRMNETLEAIARAMFKSWFVDFDPVRAKMSGEPAASICQRLGLTPDLLALFPDCLVDSKLGEIPEGWRVGTIGDHCYLNAESWTAKTIPDVVHYVDLANVKNGIISEVQILPSAIAPSRARRILRAGDTIIGTVRPGNRSFALIGEDEPQLTGSTGFAVLSPKRKALREIIFFLATSDESIDRLSRLADGAAYPAVRPEVVTAGVCVIPGKEVIDAFHVVVAKMIDSVISNCNNSEALSDIRDSLLPKLLSGELRIETRDEQSGLSFD